MKKTILFLLIFILFVFSFLNTKLNDLDVIQINQRRTYYPALLGKLYQNKWTKKFSLTRQKLFSYLDWQQK